LPLIVNASVSSSTAAPLPESNWKTTISPSTSPEMVIWNIALPAYGPNGGLDAVACTPRTVVPTKAVSVPDDWSTPLSVTSGVTAMVLAYKLQKGGGGEPVAAPKNTASMAAQVWVRCSAMLGDCECSIIHLPPTAGAENCRKVQLTSLKHL
jgi:hypothetical protein